MIRASGIILQSPEGRVLLLQRAPDAKDHPGEWCFPGGGVDGGETTEQAAVRECDEETGFKPDDAGTMLCSRVSEEDGVHFTTYLKKVDAEFLPRLNDEHVGHAWVNPKDALGGPLQ